MREEYAINDTLNVYWNLFSIFAERKPEDLPDFIRMLTAYQFEEIPIEKKINLENILRENKDVLVPDINFKIDQLTGCFCHSIREILFHFGCINNMPFVVSSEYNTVAHYAYLVDKKRHLLRLKVRLSSFFE